MCSNKAVEIDPQGDAQTLLAVAAASLRSGVAHGRPLDIDPLVYPEHLRHSCATFVTLQKDGHLRGCIGTLEPRRPAVADVAHNAYAAGFSDPRFSPLQRDELRALHIHIALLSPHEALHFKSEADLLARLRPGVDGLVLAEGLRRGTFLPAVWESLPAPADFLRQLKLKAGLPPDYWSDTLRVERYTTTAFGADFGEIHSSAS